MKICFFGTYDPDFSQNKILLDGLKDAGHEVYEVSVHTPLSQINETSHVGVSAVLLRLFHKLSIIPKAIANIKTISACDAIYIGYPGHFDVPLAWLFAKVTGKKLLFFPIINLFTVFTSNVDLFSKNSIKAKLILNFEKFIYTLPDFVFADTPYQKKYMCDEFNLNSNKVFVLPIGADDRIYKYSGVKFANSKCIVTYYGTFNPMHGVRYLIEAANILKSNKNIHFELVGKGPTWQSDYDFAKENKLDNVTFVGSVVEKDAFKYLQNADIFIGFLKDAPAVRQSIANKIYQGIAMGKPVITADTDVVRSVFTDGENMVFIPPNDPKVLASSILSLCSDPNTSARIGNSGYEMYVNNFTPIKLAESLTRVINQPGKQLV